MRNPMMPTPHEILDVIQVTAAEYTFRVAYQGDSDHGQFFQLSIPKVGEAPISVSGKGEGYLEFTIRRVGRLTDAVFELQKGDTLFMRGPYGKAFPVASYEGKDLVVIAGGTGMCPVRTTLRYAADNPERFGKKYLIAGFKEPDAVLYADEIEEFRGSFDVIATLDEGEKAGYENGMVTAHIDKIPFASFADYNVVIVGPPVMMHFAALKCLECGVPEERIWVSFERKMSCAIGKCGHCKINEHYVCVEGPVFNYSQAKDMLD